MSAKSGNRILFVDDEPCMRDVMAMLLIEEGYEVSTAADGIDALAEIRTGTPDLIITDLNMPRMSGVEFLTVVRRRFPSIPVIAISGAYSSSDNFPAGVMADAFYPKSRCHPDEFMRTIAELIQSPIRRATDDRPSQLPAVQMARRVSGANSPPAILLTCSDCLRAFSVTGFYDSGTGVQVAECEFCSTPVHFLTELPLRPAHQGALNPFQSAGMSGLLN